jgi:uncharacterized protein (DUF362 family)/Pyruvate/2-oxoacid:ferredoxin oxidoreductase delta subunit
MRKVIIKKCPSYDEPRLTEIFEDIFTHTNSMGDLKPGSKVILKTNLLLRKKPEAAATTHPIFLRALALVLIKRGFKVIVGDSPGGLFNKAFLKSIYEECGLFSAFQNTAIELNFDTDVVAVKNPNGMKLKEFSITKYLQYADYVINVPKLKTHVAMVYTGAIKNWYGTIAGERKFDYHVVAGRPEIFADTLIDIYLSTKPRLTIMDAVVGMDHNGPAAGKPVDIKLVLAGEDGFALDWTALKIVGIDPFKVPVMKAAFKRKLLAADGSDIEIAGETIEDVAIANFAAPETMAGSNAPPTASPLFKKLAELIKPKVAFDYRACKQCGECRNVCPAKAIELRGGKPRVHQKKCMKCFCCHELCTANAVKIKRSLALKAILACGLLNKRLQKTIEKMFGIIAQSRRSE